LDLKDGAETPGHIGGKSAPAAFVVRDHVLPDLELAGQLLLGRSESRRPFLPAVLQLFPDDAAEERPKVLTAALDVFPKCAIDQRLIAAAAAGFDLITEPINDLVIESDGDPGFARGERNDRSSLSSAEIIILLHCPVPYRRRSFGLAIRADMILISSPLQT
jgi:hypothetical protein